MKKPRTNQEGYELVLTFFYVNGNRHGSKSGLAEALGVTRFVVDRWERYGIPVKYLPQLRKLTGLKGSDIFPEFVN